MAETKYFTCAETAREIRKALKVQFPGVKFSVRSNQFAGGAAIDISYNEPAVPSEDVQTVVGDFKSSHFDPMTDSKTYFQNHYKGEWVSFGADYILVKNEGAVRKNCQWHPYFDCSCEAA